MRLTPDTRVTKGIRVKLGNIQARQITNTHTEGYCALNKTAYKCYKKRNENCDNVYFHSFIIKRLFKKTEPADELPRRRAAGYQMSCRT
ncbi:MAG: hypothetical protein JRI52_03880 [Deltaproteobacteria bacterium]|nr:hypothetical protein [Deltaproteobacteria bacterium]